MTDLLYWLTLIALLIHGISARMVIRKMARLLDQMQHRMEFRVNVITSRHDNERSIRLGWEKSLAYAYEGVEAAAKLHPDNVDEETANGPEYSEDEAYRTYDEAIDTAHRDVADVVASILGKE